MAKLKVPSTFRCHVRMRGVQCPCDLTMANTFTYTIATLDRKAKETGVDVDGKFLASKAICPWHAKFLAKIQKDVVRMDNVVSLLVRRERQVRATAARHAEVEARNAYLRSRTIAYQPSLGAALIEAGVVQL